MSGNRGGSTVQGGGRAVGMGLIWGTEGRSGVCLTVSVEEKWERNGVALFVDHET